MHAKALAFMIMAPIAFLTALAYAFEWHQLTSEGKSFVVLGLSSGLLFVGILLQHLRSASGLSPAEVEAERLWAKLRGEPNTDSVLASKAHFLAPVLRQFVSTATSSIRESLASEEHRETVTYEFGLYALHYIFRLAVEALGAEKAHYFTRLLAQELAKASSRGMADVTAAPLFEAQFMRDFGERSAAYLQYAEVSTVPGGELAGTLDWEFSKSFSHRIDGPEGSHVAMMMPMACPIFQLTIQKYVETLGFFGSNASS